MSIEAYRLWGQGTRTTLVLAAALDSALVRTGVLADGTLGASLRIHARVLDEERDLVAEADDDLSAQVRGAQESFADSNGPAGVGMVLYRKGWVLEPGVYDIRVALLDGLGGKVGASRLEVEVPEEVKGWRTSDVMLITTESVLNPLPVALGRFRASEDIEAYLEVREGIAPVLSGRILNVPAPQETGAPAVTPQTARTVRVLNPERLRGWGAGLHRGSIELPADLPPGHYVLEVAVADDQVAEERIFDVPLEILPPLVPAHIEGSVR